MIARRRRQHHPRVLLRRRTACVSVHGANRLGTNSLVDLVVFGRRAGRHMLEFVKRRAILPPLPVDPEFLARAEVADLLRGQRASASPIFASELQDVMMDKVSVVRNAESLTEAKQGIAQLRSPYAYAGIDDHGQDVQHRPDRSARAGRMLDCAEAIVDGALPARRAAAPTTAPTFRARRRQLARAHDAAQDVRRAWN